MDAVSIGPLVLAADRFAVVLAIFLFSIVTGILARRVDPAFHRWSWWVVIGGIVAARLGHVAIHWQSFIQEPLRILAFWQGGSFWPAGAVAIALIRLLNQDIIDLHKRVPRGSRVVVLGPEQSGKGEI